MRRSARPTLKEPLRHAKSIDAHSRPVVYYQTVYITHAGRGGRGCRFAVAPAYDAAAEEKTRKEVD